MKRFLILVMLFMTIVEARAFASPWRLTARGLRQRCRMSELQNRTVPACPPHCSHLEQPISPKPAEQVIEAPSIVGKTAARIELVFATEFTDGGTYCARLRYPSGQVWSFCVSTEDEFPGKWLPSRFYVGALHPTEPGASLVPKGSEEELKAITDLQIALAPFRTEEFKRQRAATPKDKYWEKYWQLECAEGLLKRLYQVTGRKPSEEAKMQSAPP